MHDATSGWEGTVSTSVKRSLVAGTSVVIAAAIGIITNIATNHAGLAWWVSLGALLVIGVGAQVWLTSTEGQAASVRAAGAGSVAVGGSTQSTVSTRARNSAQQSPSEIPSEGVLAAGSGSIAIGGEAAGGLSTDVDTAD
ncbi:hypothetical protein GCM10010393_02720 [Streptomyces gobitricini]|uniref:Holin n=1 Tax=Streptomyces gobitricini TaxID=68211 RepID=A0ABP5YAT7_9ACTN